MPEPLVSNTVTATMGFVPVEPEGLRVIKRAIKRDARIGGILTYRVEVENTGAGALFGARLVDRLPQGFEVSQMALDGRQVPFNKIGSHTVAVDLGNLAAGQRVTLNYSVLVGTNASPGRNENCAEATARDGGANLVRGRDCALVMLGAGDLEWLGEIRAKAYLDVDGNRLRNAADQPLAGIEFILVPPGVKQLTDEDGEALFPGLESGQFVVALNTRVLEEPFVYTGDTSELVNLLEGERAEVLFLISAIPKEGFLEIDVTVERIE